MKRPLLILLLAVICSSVGLRAQDARAALDAASAALGAANLHSLEFSGRGSDGVFGQAYDTNSPWPRFSVPSLTMAIDFTTPAMRDDRRRQQLENPPLGGGVQPLVGERRQTWLLSGAYAWDMVGENAVPPVPERDYRSAIDGRLAQIWLTPHGFVKAAAANGATARTETIRGAKKTIVSFTAPGKMRFEAVIGEQNDFGGVKFPTHIVQRNGGYPVLDLTVTDVKPNAPVRIDVPANIRQAAAPGPVTLQAERLSDGVWIVPGAAKSIAVEFKDHIVVVDAPETEARSIAVIDAIKRTIPGKPIRYVINTHHHFDHSGGLRTYAAEGATIVTQQANIPFYENAWRNPRTISPDRLARSGRTPVFEGVVGSRVMSDGVRELDIYHYAGNRHNPGMLMIYLPRERALLEADSWTPPGNPGESPEGVPNLVHFYDAVNRLQLDVEQVVPMHGRLTTFSAVRDAVETYGNTQAWAK